MAKSEGRKGSISSANTKIALYRKYRPTKLEQVVGQPQVTDVLAAAAKSRSFAHAYLFTGQRGTGKTTVARILAHMINELDYDDNINSNNVDIIEIDAASNNGVDDVREIRDSVNLAPMNCSHKVYIIDEFHMLSKPAFNALLKTIEEPPEFVVFILATTELQKVPATILSRVQRFHFRPLTTEQLTNHLRFIANNEKIKVDDEALTLIAKAGGGSVRDSITLLDQLSNNDQITVDLVNSTLGLVSDEITDCLINDVIYGNFSGIVTTVQSILSDGNNASALSSQLVGRLQQKAISENNSSLFALIDKLLDVSKSAMPDTKLLAELVNFACKTENAPRTPLKPTVKTQHKSMPAAAKTTEEVASKALDSEPTNNPESKQEKQTEQTVSHVKVNKIESHEVAVSPTDDGITDLSWEDVLKQLADKDRPSTRSLLEQCDYRYDPDNNCLTLYFGRTWHRKQAKSRTFSDALSATFDELYHSIPQIIISEESAPADSDVAAVLKLVGGEVTSISDGTI